MPEEPKPGPRSASSSAPSAAPTPDPRGTAPALVQATLPTLPVGGGAIRGIGEKFSTGAATGTGSLSIPIPVTPSRGGFHPDLALAYDSGTGNGPFGAGWRLSIPSITRKTDKQLPTYLDADDADVFVLSGAEDLVPVAELPPEPGETVTITRYQPRVEAGFARIERHRDGASGEVWWVSYTPANVRSEYGRTAGARIVDPDDEDRVFSWLLERTEDAIGNVVVYEYLDEDLVGVATVPGERHRVLGFAKITNKYPKWIRYANTQPRDAGSCAFQVVLDYGDHGEDAPTPQPDRAWPVRPDPFSSYRAGFEIRTYRRCARVLVFHELPEPELGSGPCLVRSVALTHDDDPALGHLIAVEQRGHIRNADGTYQPALAVPALRLGYTEADRSGAVTAIDLDTCGDLAGGVDGARHQWVDLDAEGIPGALTDAGGALYFRRNLGAGLLGPAVPVSTPSPAMLAGGGGGGQHLADVDGDGRLELVAFGGALPGFFSRVPAGAVDLEPGDRDLGTWEAFQTFAERPQIDWTDPAVRFIDLDGDGRDDVLIMRDDEIVWYPSLGKDGFGPPRTLARSADDERGPTVLFADATRSIVFADLSGDGLRDLVRIQNGSICYWPNRGHGRFGAMVEMAGAPAFDAPDQFEARRVLLHDIDGSGTSDVIYAGRVGVRYWLNQAGNGWGAAIALPDLPADTTAASLTAVDLLGTGTCCLVWSSSAPADTTLYYFDLVGGVKPHLLDEIDNQLGFVTRLQYAASTKFYLEDRAAGIRWQTQLGFPVHVVERVETYDSVRRVRFVSTYRFRDGYFDGYEREFRGFGYVEQRDTESIGADLGKGLFAERDAPINGEYPQPPAVTRTWFHTGAWLDDGPDARIVVLDHDALSPAESREAYRALRGSVLRREVLAEDGTDAADKPYTVAVHGYEVRCLRRAGDQSHGVFLAYPRETITWHSERQLDDPRIGHEVTVEVDDLGHVVRSVAIGYGRSGGASDPDRRDEQEDQLATLTEVDVANEIEEVDWYRHGVPLETRTYELIGLPKATGGVPLTVAQIRTIADAAVAVPYDGTSTAPAWKRLVERARTRYYDADALPAPLPFGEIDRLALTYEAYGLVFTPSLLTSLYGDRVDGALLEPAGYCHLDDPGDADSVTGWWARSGRSVPDLDPLRFHLPVAFLDPFDNPPTTVEYDDYFLLLEAVTDPLGSTIAVENDYRLMGPLLSIGPNGNQVKVEVDALGRVTKQWLIGNPDRDEGDRDPDQPTVMFDYTFGAPSLVHTAARETHRDPATRWQHAYGYSDGAGHEVMKKVQAAPGKAMHVAPDGVTCVEVDADPRWLGTGRTVLDNKGNPIKQYEPYFSVTSAYEDEEALVCAGVTPILHYDPLGRLILTERPDGSLTRVEFTPWRQASYDANDTVRDAGNVWYAGAIVSPDAAVRRAAQLAYDHANTPAVSVFDSLGRAIVAIADNGPLGRYLTRTRLDLEGNPLAVIDALDRECVTRRFSMLGQACFQHSIDAGDRWAFVDVAGKSVRGWDAGGQVIETVYDVLRRRIEVWIAKPSRMLVEQTVYGEAAPADDPELTNMRGRQWQQRDGTGIATSVGYDFKGNARASTRQLASDYTTTLDWSQNVALDPEVFRSSTEYDALNRATRITTPDGTIIVPGYNLGTLLETVNANVRGAAETTRFVGDIDYNEKGQRERIVYGAEGDAAAITTFSFDPLTFRLAGILTTRSSGSVALQDVVYTFDSAGNVVAVTDAVQQPVYFDGVVSDGTQEYSYEPVYRLSRATGREYAGGSVRDHRRTHEDFPVRDLPHPEALRPYEETYQYDRVGNLEQITHAATGGATWRAPMHYTPGTNRLEATMAEGDDEDGPFHALYGYDAHGNMTSMPHLTRIEWDWKDQMRAADTGGGTVYFTYDAGGQRVRKVWEHGGLLEERIYLGGFEVYRLRSSGALTLERQTVHIMDGSKRIAMVETKTIDTALSVLTPTPLIRFQLGNHLGSVLVEIDERGRLISYEEYHPYGTSAYRAASSQMEVSAKRYRYTGKERDEETSLAYHGARYYAPWLCRWTAPDPAGAVDGPNLYGYVAANPVGFVDNSGAERAPPNLGLGPEATDRMNRLYVLQEEPRRLTPDEIGDLYQTCPDLEYAGPATPQVAQEQSDRLSAGAAKREHAAKEFEANPLPNKKERWEIAKNAAQNYVVDHVKAGVQMALGPVGSLAAPLIDTALEPLQAEKPPELATNNRERAMQETYAHAQTTLMVGEAALSLVPIAEIGQAAKLALDKMPVLEQSLGIIGKPGFVLHADLWAAEKIIPKQAVPLIQGPHPTLDLAREIMGKRHNQAVTLVATKEGPTLVAARPDLTAKQIALAEERGLVVVPKLAGFDAESKAVQAAGELELTPSHGVVTVKVCDHCRKTLFGELGAKINEAARGFVF